MIHSKLLIIFGIILTGCDGTRQPEDSVALRTEKIPLFREWVELFNEKEIPIAEPVNTADRTYSSGPSRSKAILEQLGGIPFPEGASAIYDGQKRNLIVRNTPENLKMVHTMLDVYFSIPHLTRQLERATESADDGLGSDNLRGTRGGYLEAHAFVSFHTELFERQYELEALQEAKTPRDSAAIQTLIDEIKITENFVQQSRDAYRQSLVKQLELCRQWQDLVYGKNESEPGTAGQPATPPLLK